MSVTSFLRRFSIDAENANSNGSSSSSAPGSASSSGPTKRRGRIAASIDSARRRFSLQHGAGGSNQDPVHLQSIALRGRGTGENGSLPDLIELENAKKLTLIEINGLFANADSNWNKKPAIIIDVDAYCCWILEAGAPRKRYD